MITRATLDAITHGIDQQTTHRHEASDEYKKGFRAGLIRARHVVLDAARGHTVTSSDRTPLLQRVRTWWRSLRDDVGEHDLMGGR